MTNLPDRLKRYSKKAIADALDTDFADAVWEAADVAPVLKSHWYWDEDGMDWGIGAWRCDNCKSSADTWWANDKKYNPLRCSGGKFCGNCGADMRGVDNG